MIKQNTSHYPFLPIKPLMDKKWKTSWVYSNIHVGFEELPIIDFCHKPMNG